MSRAEYTALPGCNFSTLKHLLRSPAHYQESLKEKEEDDLKYAVGTLAHAMVLEGKNMLDLYAIKPEGMSFATKEGKAWKAEQTKPILEADAAKVPLMAEAIAKHPLARAVLARCQEREAPAQADIDGVLCKGLFDAFGRDSSGTGVIPDFKTTTDARKFKFRRKAEFDLDYDLQSALYKQLALNARDMECETVWIVQETSAPFAVMIYQPGPDLIASGNDKLAKVLTLWKECEASGIWPAYQSTPTIEIL